MATTEGALVASHSRGMHVMNLSGGATSKVIREGYSQNPILTYETAQDAVKASKIADKSFKDFIELTNQTTSHGKLISAAPQVLGRRMIYAMVFTTGDAIGSNMGVKAAEVCSAELARRTAAKSRYVHGQDVEKRANQRAVVEGRGRSVVCEVTIPKTILKEKMRTTPEKMKDILDAYRMGYAHLGTQNWTLQAANGLAAVMIACGQDVAYVTENATGLLDFEVNSDGDLYASVYLPSLLVGTVGGGTHQGTAKECLDIMSVRGTGGANTFAEILGAVVLAGDLSLLAAFTTHEFVAAHESLGRNRP